MSAVTLASLVDRLPPGRARARYARLLAETGAETVAVRVAHASEPIWLVRSLDQAAALVERGVPRWRVWTLHEVNSFLSACGSPVSTVAEAARLLGKALAQGRHE